VPGISVNALAAEIYGSDSLFRISRRKKVERFRGVFPSYEYMDDHKAPMLLPAACFTAGTLLVFHASYLSVPLLALLGLISLALGRRVGLALAFLSFGLLAAAVRLGLPADPADQIDRDRPVEALVKVSGHWAADDEGWSSTARLVHLRQGDRVTAPPLQMI